MESLHVSAYAKGVVATEVTELAAKLLSALGVVNVPHVSLHVGLVHTLVRTERAGKLRATRIHLTAELHVSLQQMLQRVDFSAEEAHVSLVHRIIFSGLRRVFDRLVVIAVCVPTHVPASSS